MKIGIKENIIDSSRKKILDWFDKAIKKLQLNWEDLKVATNREKKETIAAFIILRKLIAGEEVSDFQKRFLKSQSLDVIKILFHISLKFIPLPIPFSPLMIYIGKKIGVNTLPSSQNLEK